MPSRPAPDRPTKGLPYVSASDDPSSAVARDLQLLRSTLARELETINEYERAVSQASSPEVKALLAHLRDEEKEHVAECMEYIRRLDSEQDAYFRRDVDAHLSSGAARSSPRPAAPARATQPGAFTIGSLKRSAGG